MRQLDLTAESAEENESEQSSPPLETLSPKPRQAAEADTENDRLIAELLQEEFNFEFEISKKAKHENDSESDFSIHDILPKIATLFSSSSSSSKEKPRVLFSYVLHAASQQTIDDDDERKDFESECSSMLAETYEKYDEFATRLNTAPELAEFGSHIKTFITEFVNAKLELSQQIGAIHDFLDFADVQAAHIQPKVAASFTRLQLRLFCERFLLSTVYCRVFEIEMDRERMEQLSQRIKRHSWIQLGHLDLDARWAAHEEELRRATEEIAKIDSSKSPTQKIIHFVAACKTVFAALRRENMSGSADEFLPLMIFTVLRAQPSRFYSNVQFVMRFKRHTGAEVDYYLTHLMAIVEFLFRLSHKTLSIARADYDKMTRLFSDNVVIELDDVKKMLVAPIASIGRWFEQEFLHKDSNRLSLAAAESPAATPATPTAADTPL